MTHTLNEERDINSSQGLFEGAAHIKVDPEMLKLAVQLVQRQARKYDPADLEDRYETRLRASRKSAARRLRTRPNRPLASATSSI